ncbi:MAG TPA: hypothetical protein VGS19_04940 [Streptosporangiaceae bacterium]|nr:hypothetical protein [Streptosporangiaceae bacterium]
MAWAEDHGLLAETPMEVSWCLSYKRDLVRDLAEPSPQDLDLLLWQEGRLSAFYAPWDWVNTAAKVMLVGITAGYFQAAAALWELSAACSKAWRTRKRCGEPTWWAHSPAPCEPT